MDIILKKIKKNIPNSIKQFYYSWFHYEEFDTSDFWRKKASKGGWQAIYWHNERYNALFDAEQKKYLVAFLQRCGIGLYDPILDLGCGIGRLSKFFSDLGYKNITAVDFPEMVDNARLENGAPSVQYIASSAQEFYVDRTFRLILSSSCFGMIRKHEYLFKSLDNCIKMQTAGDRILMIDPFHKYNYLALFRVKIAGSKVIKYMEQQGYALEEKSGMLFIPVKILITNKWGMKENTTEKLFYFGETLLALLSRYYFADYKILSFRKQN